LLSQTLTYSEENDVLPIGSSATNLLDGVEADNQHI